jgi:hypothetical protein
MDLNLSVVWQGKFLDIKMEKQQTDIELQVVKLSFSILPL